MRENLAVTDNKMTALRQCRHGMMLYLRKDMYIGRSFELYGEFSEGEIALFSQIMRPGDVVAEAGANIGAHTVFFAKAVGHQGMVIAYEPQRFVHQILCANVALNELTNVHARHAALGEIPGQTTVPVPDYGQTENFGGLPVGIPGETVSLETIDSLNLRKLRLIKADVEGMEIGVIRGAIRTIRELRPILYVENDRQENSETLIELIRSLSYRLWWHLPPLFNPNNFAGNTENVFGNIVSVNLLCIPKEIATDIAGMREILNAGDRWWY